MANIVLTNLCNLSCPYCFAEDLRTEDIQHISQEALDEITKFLERSHAQEVGLIGGEPTLHPKFEEIATHFANHPGFRKVFVYTNGLQLAQYFPKLLRPDICYLINVNDPQVIGEHRFQRIRETLELAEGYHMLQQISLGVNLYAVDQRFEAVLALCKRFGFSALRISVVVPSDAQTLDRLEYFTRLKPTLLALYQRMKEMGITPKYDCNVVPSCVFTKEELEFCASMPGSQEDIQKITGKKANCRPVIDIYPDLSIARCFGMSGTERRKLTDFVDLWDAVRYYIYQVDGKRLYTESCNMCLKCYRRQVLQCYGGCIAFFKREHVELCTDSGN